MLAQKAKHHESARHEHLLKSKAGMFNPAAQRKPRGGVIRLVAVSCAALGLGLFGLAAVAQHGHPLVGTWSGYWQTESERGRVLLLLDYEADAITGVLNPGRNAAALTRASLDPATWTVVFEASREDGDGNVVQTVIEGRIENVTSPIERTISGTWTRDGTPAEFQVTLN